MYFVSASINKKREKSNFSLFVFLEILNVFIINTVNGSQIHVLHINFLYTLQKLIDRDSKVQNAISDMSIIVTEINCLLITSIFVQHLN